MVSKQSGEIKKMARLQEAHLMRFQTHSRARQEKRVGQSIRQSTPSGYTVSSSNWLHGDWPKTLRIKKQRTFLRASEVFSCSFPKSPLLYIFDLQDLKWQRQLPIDKANGKQWEEMKSNKKQPEEIDQLKLEMEKLIESAFRLF